MKEKKFDWERFKYIFSQTAELNDKESNSQGLS